MKCDKCGSKLKRIHDQSSEPEGIRQDAWCSKCEQRFMVTKSHVVPIDGGAS